MRTRALVLLTALSAPASFAAGAELSAEAALKVTPSYGSHNYRVDLILSNNSTNSFRFMVDFRSLSTAGCNSPEIIIPSRADEQYQYSSGRIYSMQWGQRSFEVSLQNVDQNLEANCIFYIPISIYPEISAQGSKDAKSGGIDSFTVQADSNRAMLPNEVASALSVKPVDVGMVVEKAKGDIGGYYARLLLINNSDKEYIIHNKRLALHCGAQSESILIKDVNINYELKLRPGDWRAHVIHIDDKSDRIHGECRANIELQLTDTVSDVVLTGAYNINIKVGDYFVVGKM